MGAIWRLQGVPHLARHMGVICQCHVVAIATVLLLSTRWSCAQVTLSPSASQPDAATSSQLLQPSPTATMHTYSTERTVSSPSLAYSSSSGMLEEASTSDLNLKTISSNTVQSSSTRQMFASVTTSAFRSVTILPSEQSVSYRSSISHQSSVSHQSLVPSQSSVSHQSLVSSQSSISHQSLVSSQSSVSHQSLVSSQSSVPPYSSSSTVNQTAVMPKAGGLQSSTSVVSTAGSMTISSMEQTSALIQPTPTITSTDRSALRTSESSLYPSPTSRVVSTPLSASVNPPLSTEVLPSSVRLVESSNSSVFPTPPTSSDALLSSSEFRFSNDSGKGLMPSSRAYSIEPTASPTSTIPPRSSTILSFNMSVAVSSTIFTSSVGSSSTELLLSSTAVPIISTQVVPSSFTSRLASSEVTSVLPTPSQTSPVATTTAMTSSTSSVALRPTSVVMVTSSVAMVMSSSVNGTGGGVQAPAGSGGLPLAVLVGIVIACCVFVTICVVLMILLCFKRGGAYGAGSKKPNPANGGLWDDGVTLSYINSHIELPKEQGEEMKSLEGETDDPTPAAFTNYGYTDEANTVSTRL